MKNVRLIIPSSTSNIGPGFDTLGIGLEIYNEVELVQTGRGVEIEFERGVEEIFKKAIRGLTRRAARAFEAESGKTVNGLTLIFRNDAPIARGLGSSASFRMGALAALNEWHDKPLEMNRLIDIGCKLEKHTENCVACAIGGLTASGIINGRVMFAKYNIHEKIVFVAAIPEKPMSTSENRKILPRRISLADAVFNLNRTALLIDAFGTGKFDRLGDLLEDKLHQPHRAKILNPLFKVIDAAREAGAFGGFLSGSGSTIMAVAENKIEEISKAMQVTLHECGWPAKVVVLKPDRKGIRLAE